MNTPTVNLHPRDGRFRPIAFGLLSFLAAAHLPGQTTTPPTTPPAAGKTAADRAGTEPAVLLEKFQVTAGFRGSLAAASEMKQAQPVITEVLAAEDIGKLPDVSIAESLSRLPGITSQRQNGRSQALSIRGMTGDFSTGLLNGREQVTTGSNRAVEFDQYPAELLSGAVVYKSADAALIGQGLAGTVDLRTVRPLSQGRRTFAASAFYEWTELGALNAGSEKDGMRYSASYIDQLADGKFGVALGFSSTDKPGQGEQWNAWGYPNVDASVNASRPFVLGGAKPFVRSSQLERDGFMGVFEFKPNDLIHSTLDLYTSTFKETQLLRGIEIPLYWSSAQLQPGFTVQDGLITQATFRNVFGVMRNDIVLRDADVFSAGWNLRLGKAEGWSLIADINYSKIERKDTVLETYSGTGSNQVGTADTLTYSLASGTGARFTPSLDYTNTSLVRLASPQGWGGDIVPGGQLGYMKSPLADDELQQYKLIAKRDLKGFFSSFEVGVSYSQRTKSEIEDSNFLALANGQTSAPLPSSNGITNLSFIGIPGMASYDPLAALNSGVYRVIRNPNADVVSVDWNVKEEVTLGYAQLGLDRDLGRVPMKGNVGFQLVHSDQSSSGLSATGTGASVRSLPVSGSHDYVDFVPSLNLSFTLAERRYLRLSLARQLARQRMNDMRAGSNFNFNSSLSGSTNPQNGPWSGTGGNPALEPWRSNSLDLSLEQYFRDNMGYVSLAGFYKDLRTYTYNQSTLADFTGYPTGGGTPAITQGLLTVPQNGQGGKMKGLEVTFSLASEMFTRALPGLGLVANAAYTDSSIQPDLTNPATTLPGLSKKVASLTIYYERRGFSARVSQRYRSEYRANVSTFGPRGEDFRTVEAESVIDAQVSYAFRSGPLSGLTLLLQGNNLNNEPLSTYETVDSRLVRDYQQYGRAYAVGLSYKF
jgi:iron complex outermembrane receptor protein